MPTADSGTSQPPSSQAPIPYNKPFFIYRHPIASVSLETLTNPATWRLGAAALGDEYSLCFSEEVSAQRGRPVCTHIPPLCPPSPRPASSLYGCPTYTATASQIQLLLLRSCTQPPVHSEASFQQLPPYIIYVSLSRGSFP